MMFKGIGADHMEWTEAERLEIEAEQEAIRKAEIENWEQANNIQPEY